MSRQRMMDNFSRAAMEYDRRAQFQHTETMRVLDAARMILPEQARIADIGCGTGYFAEQSFKRPGWQIMGIDLAPGMCAQAAKRCMAIQADAVALPLADGSCDAVVSSLCLQWVFDLPAAFAEIARVLRPGGRAIIASLGSGSLPELRGASAAAGMTLGLLDMQPAEHYRAALDTAGLETIMFKQDAGIDYYADVLELLNSMRLIGAGNPTGSRGLQGASRWKAMLAQYETLRGAEGLPATWERIFMIVSKR